MLTEALLGFVGDSWAFL